MEELLFLSVSFVQKEQIVMKKGWMKAIMLENTTQKEGLN